MTFFSSPSSRKSFWVNGKEYREKSPDCFEEYCRRMEIEWGPDTPAAEDKPQPAPVATTASSRLALLRQRILAIRAGRSTGPGTLSSRGAEALPQATQAGPSRLPAQRSRTPESDEGLELAVGSKRRRVHSDDSDESYVPSGSRRKKTRAVAALPRKKVKTEHIALASGVSLASAASSPAGPSASLSPGPGLLLKTAANGMVAPIPSDSQRSVRCCIGYCDIEVSGTKQKAWRSHITLHHPASEATMLVQCGWANADGTVCEAASAPDSRARHIALVHLKDGDACPVLGCAYVGRKDAVWRHMGSIHGVNKSDRAGA